MSRYLEAYGEHVGRFSLPAEAARDCSRPGPADEAVAYWASKRRSWPDRANIEAELAEYGAWTREELAEADEETLRHRLFWIMAGNAWDNAGGYACSRGLRGAR